ncbi:hypothetical protein C7271_25040 [filamentous cyanobacterium CCP5]|nr:hypothetical protein C7271_25040 [filamentous cyanobacterium CCP5]
MDPALLKQTHNVRKIEYLINYYTGLSVLFSLGMVISSITICRLGVAVMGSWISVESFTGGQLV